MSTTPHLELPFIEAAQAQKHVTHNEALQRLDAVIQLSVADRDLATPPTDAADGGRWLVAAGATGVWSGTAGRIAARIDGAWVFLAPRTGWRCWVEDESRLLVYDAAAGLWRDFADAAGLVRAASLADGSLARLGVNTAADTTNRLSVKTDGVLLSHDDVSGTGSGHLRIAVDKRTAAHDAGLMFQTGWSSRALFGLLGDDDVTLKVSADGSSWTEALRIAAATGRLTLQPGGLSGGGRLVACRWISASGTWTRPAGVRTVLVWALGAGGGGGGASGAASSGAAGGGGGAGGLAVRLIDVAAIASRTLTVGTGGNGGAATGATGSAGGATSFGSDVVASGGAGGIGMAAAAWATAVTGGAGGDGPTGDFGFTGAPGGAGLRFDGANVLSGSGGASHFGGGGRGNVGNAAGGSGTARGSGGSGGAVAASATGQAGGRGADGLLWIWEFE